MVNVLSGSLNVFFAIENALHGRFEAMQVSLFMVVVVSLVGWGIVWSEQRIRLMHETRAEFLKEQKADTQLKEKMVEHLTKVQESGGNIDLGFPVAIGTRRRDH